MVGRERSKRVRSVCGKVGALLLLGLFPSAAGAQIPLPFAATYAGGFWITFGTAPGGDNDLRLNGPGLAFPLGLSGVEGHSTTRPRADNPGGGAPGGAGRGGRARRAA